MFLQQDPIVVEVIKQPPPAKDISIDVILGMFEMAGVVLLAAAIGGLIAGLIFIGIRKLRDGSGRSPDPDSEHVKLRI